MSRGLMRGVVGLCIAVVVPESCAGEAAAQARQPINWIRNYEAGKAEARRSGKPIFLVFRCVP